MRIINPYELSFSLPWFKGDLHIHSNLSDGRASVERILERLRECGFDFAALADHNHYASSSEHSQPLLIGNSEMCGSEGGDVLTLFAAAPRDPKIGVQALIDQVRRAGGLPILAHPRIGEFGMIKHHRGYPSHELIGEYRDYLGIEIYTHNIGSGFQSAIERLDALWISRCQESSEEPVGVWDFATSDSNDLERISSNVDIMVAAERCDLGSLRAAIEGGRFYSLADSSARFREITVSQDTVRVIAEQAQMLCLYGCQQKDATGDRRLLAIAWGVGNDHLTLEYEITGKEGFVRIEAADLNGGFIYTNPIQILI